DIGLNIATLSQFYEQPFESQTLVVNYSGLSLNDIQLAVRLLTQLLSSQ
ncbi:PLP-dependent aminotransferase family protein, partial [Coprobacillus cateniformis]|nr:PLP-dependent aminotransferase family protein [Coprobacillus cateniformis]